jgi:hypothetical protein
LAHCCAWGRKYLFARLATLLRLGPRLPIIRYVQENKYVLWLLLGCLMSMVRSLFDKPLSSAMVTLCKVMRLVTVAPGIWKGWPRVYLLVASKNDYRKQAYVYVDLLHFWGYCTIVNAFNAIDVPPYCNPLITVRTCGDISNGQRVRWICTPGTRFTSPSPLRSCIARFFCDVTVDEKVCD